MKISGKCPKCGETKIIKDAKVVDRGHHNVEQELRLATFLKPDALLFKGKESSTVSAWVCASCGFVELYADHPVALAAGQGLWG